MSISMWSYPWDLEDCGMAYALDDMKAHGIDGVSMITSYHAGRFLCIRSPKRKIYFPEDGVAYYPCDMKKFEHQRIQPRQAQFSREHPDFWPKLFEETEKRGMTVSGWTVCLHNTRIGMAYPDTCVHNAYGDAVYYNQCPSNPDVRTYMCTLLDDLCTQVPLDALELESMNFMGHAHEYHHEKDGIGLSGLQDFLLSICFCDHCKARARAKGIDADAAQQAVHRMLAQLSETQFTKEENERFFVQKLAFFENEPALYAFLKWRPSVVTSLVEEAHQAVGGRAKMYFLSLLPHSGSWLFGVDLKAITGLCEGALVCSYDCGTQKMEADVRESQRDFAGGSKLLLGMRCFTPEYADGAALIDKVRASRRMGVEDFRFYNYGLIPQSHLDWIREALQ